MQGSVSDKRKRNTSQNILKGDEYTGYYLLITCYFNWNPLQIALFCSTKTHDARATTKPLIAKPSSQSSPHLSRLLHITCAVDHPLCLETLSSSGFQNITVCLYRLELARALACSLLYSWWWSSVGT